MYMHLYLGTPLALSRRPQVAQVNQRQETGERSAWPGLMPPLEPDLRRGLTTCPGQIPGLGKRYIMTQINFKANNMNKAKM